MEKEVITLIITKKILIEKHNLTEYEKVYRQIQKMICISGKPDTKEIV